MSDLYDRWKANNHRPTWVRDHRDELNAAISTSEPIPASGTYEVRRWLERYRGTVTRQLDDDTDGSDPHNGETTTTDDAETTN